MRAKYFVLSIALVLLISLVFISTANGVATPILKISPTDIQLTSSAVGSTLQVNITVQDVTNLMVWQTQVLWNPNVLNLTEIKQGPFLQSAGSTMLLAPRLNDTKPGEIQNLACTLMSFTSGADGSGTLATLSFKVLSVQQSTIQLNNTGLFYVVPTLNPETQSYDAVNFSIEHTKTDGQITLVQSTPTPTVTPTPSPTGSPGSSPTSDPTELPTSSPSSNPSSSPSGTPSTSSSPGPLNTPANNESITVLLIVVAGVIMAVLILVGVMFQRR